MKLTVKDVATLLGIPELTIKRWIHQGKIPVLQTKEGYRFNKKETEKWAQAHNLFLDTGSDTDSAPQKPHKAFLFEAMKRGDVFFNLKGKNVSDVLREAVFLSPLPENIDKEFLIDMLLQREKLVSTGTGSGIATPHPRYPLKELHEYSFITTCFLDKAIDFNAIDGLPVFVIFLLLSSSTKMHLNLLSRLGFCFRDGTFIYFLKKCTNAKDFLQKIKEKELSLVLK